MLGEASFALLAEEELPVGHDVVLPLRARDDLRLVRRFLVELGRETRGPAVIAVSDGAVQDPDVHHALSLARPSAAPARHGDSARNGN
jgi:hypothetical protein